MAQTERSLIKEHPEDVVLDLTNTDAAAPTSARFTVTLRNRPANTLLRIQWLRNGQPLPAVPGIGGSDVIIQHPVTRNPKRPPELEFTLEIHKDLCPLLAGRYSCQVTRVPRKKGGTGADARDEAEEPQVDCSRDVYLTAIWSQIIPSGDNGAPKNSSALIVAGAPIIGTGGTTNGCPGPYRAYTNFTGPDGKGFKPISSSASLTVTSPDKLPLKWFGANNSTVTSACAVEEYNPPNTPQQNYATHRFSLYFPVGGAHDLTKTYQLYLFGFQTPKRRPRKTRRPKD